MRSLRDSVSFLIIAGLFAGASLVAILSFRSFPTYPDFIVGPVTWGADSKIQDLLALPAVGTIFIFGYFFLASRAAKAPHLTEVLLWWCLPAVMALAPVMMGHALDRGLLFLSAFGLLVIVGLSALRKCEPALISRALLSVIFLSLFPFGIAATLRSVLSLDSKMIEASAKAILLSGILSVLVLSWVRATVLRTILARFLPLTQLGLAFFFFLLVPPKIVGPAGPIALPSQAGLWFLAGLLAVCTIVDILRRAFRKDIEPFSPLAIFALLMAVRFGQTTPPFIDPDDYHFGERLLGSWIYSLGGLPYVDYIPPHGIVDDDFPGMINRFFFDGSAALTGEASRVAYVLLALPAFLLMSAFTGSLSLTLVGFYFLHGVFQMGAGLKWIYFIPFICLWFGGQKRIRPGWWLITWWLSSIILILGVPPQGLLLMVASIPLALWQLIRLRRSRGDFIYFGLGLLGASAAVLVSPVGSMFFAAIRYVLENGPINQIAYGIPWHISFDVSSNLLLELARMSWVGLPTAVIVLLFSRRMQEKPLAIFALLVSVSFIPYCMGRIDPGSLSRPGIFSIFSWSVLAPMIFFKMTDFQVRPLFVLALALINGLLTVRPVLLFDDLRSAVASELPVGPLKNGADYDMHNLGRAMVEEKHFQAITALQSFLSQKLSPGETYLDLTGRHAQYFYFNRRPLLDVTAPYNMVAPKQQIRAVEKLKSMRPRVVLLKSNLPTVEHDGGGLALRNPIVVSYIIHNYIPRLEDGFIVGYLYSAHNDLISDYEAQLFAKVFSREDLQKIPIAWGRSLASLEGRMRKVLDLEGRFVSDGQSVVARSLKFDGSRGGLLKIDLACADLRAEPRLQISWNGAGLKEPPPTITLTGASGPLIIPLDSNPRWTLARDIDDLHIHAGPNCERVSIRNAGIYSREF